MCLCCARRRHERTKQRCLFVKAALNKSPVLPMSLYYHGYRKLLLIYFSLVIHLPLFGCRRRGLMFPLHGCTCAIGNKCMHICGNFQGQYTRCFLFSFITNISLAAPSHKDQCENQKSQFLTIICFSFNILNKSKKES